MTLLQENAAKALDSINFAAEELRDCIASANSVEFIVIMGLLEDCTTLRSRISEFKTAIAE